MDIDIQKAQKYMRLAGLDAKQVSAMIDAGYFEKPASTRYHLSCDGGLAIHSLHVVDNILLLTPVVGVKWELERSPYLIGMLHDFVKCYCYSREATLGKWVFCNHKYESASHGEASVMYIDEVLGISLNRQELMAILHHMGAYRLDSNQLRYFSDAKREMPREILCTHWADDKAASIDEASL